MPVSRLLGQAKFLSVHIASLGDTVVLERVGYVVSRYLWALSVDRVQHFAKRSGLFIHVHFIILVAKKQLLKVG